MSGDYVDYLKVPVSFSGHNIRLVICVVGVSTAIDAGKSHV
jgi:hypothetical protein